MKKYFAIILCCVFMLLSGMTNAQKPANRTVSTIVADALAQLPANRQSSYNNIMKDLASTDAEGVKALADMMGHGDDSKVQYALSGLAAFATSDATMKKNVEQSFLSALESTKDNETKAFLIRQLQLVASDASLDKLSVFLSNDILSSPAANAISAIGSDAAGEALFKALSGPLSNKAQSNVIEALSTVKAPAGTEALVQSFLTSDDNNVKKTALNTLSRIGTKASLPALAVAAAKTGYKMEPTGANEAYIGLLKNVLAQGGTKDVASAANKMLKGASKAGSLQSQIAALSLLFPSQADKTKVLTNALKNGSKEYRNAALNFASDYANKAMYTELLKGLAKSKTDDKIDVLNWIGREAQNPDKAKLLNSIEIGADKNIESILIQQLGNSDFGVKQAAAWVMNKLGNKAFIPILAGLLSSNDANIINLAKNALASYSGDVSPTLANVMNGSSDAGKIAALDLLALRKSDSFINTVLDQTKSPSPNVKAAAYRALKDVATNKDIVNLCGLLETADPSSVAPLQNAVSAAIASMKPEERTEAITRRMLQAGDAKKYLYYPVLATTGDKKSLETIIKGFNSEKGAAKEMAFEALQNWKGFDASEPLYNICKNTTDAPYFDRALESYTALASGNNLTGDNRLIFLRKAMEVAKTDDQKNKILKHIGNTSSFMGLLFAGKFLDNNALKDNAAQAVMNIALANKDFTGSEIVDLLKKASAALSNPDADYQREAINKHLNEMPKDAGFISIFNGRDLTGWKGLVGDPIKRAKMTPAAMKRAQAKADEIMRRDWKVENGLLVYDGTGYENICTEKDYGDFEMFVDWMLDPNGKEPDAGIYLRGTPQVQIWDTSRVNVGAQVGSGGLYNNKVHPDKPLKVADNKVGEWNTFYIKMVGDRVTVKLNGELVVDNVILENYWNRELPIPSIEQIELQAHGSKVYYRNIYVKELERPEPFTLSNEEKKEGFKILFDGTNMHEWTGNLVDYVIDDGCISVAAETKFGGNLYTKNEYANFVYRFDFQLTPGANNGVGIRTPLEGDAAYVGMEIQILDCEHPIYKNITPLQHHGSVYGIIPALPEHHKAFKPAGEWNSEEILADGDHIRVTVNGVVILDGNIREAAKDGTADKKEHPGLFNKKGHIGFLGHGSAVKFRNIRIKELK